MTERKPKPVKVRCMDCAELVMEDMWCPRYQRDILDPYLEIRCRGYVRIK